jgi:hypothetical protein
MQRRKGDDGDEKGMWGIKTKETAGNDPFSLREKVAEGRMREMSNGRWRYLPDNAQPLRNRRAHDRAKSPSPALRASSPGGRGVVTDVGVSPVNPEGSRRLAGG